MSVADLKQERRTLKGSLTRTLTFITTTTQWTGKDLVDLRLRFQKFDEIYKRFFKIQSELEKLEPEQIDENYQQCDEFDQKFFGLSAQITLILDEHSVESRESVKSSSLSDNSELSVRMKEQIARIDQFFEGGYNNNIIELECRLNQLSLSWNRFESASNGGETGIVEGAYFQVFGKIKKHLIDTASAAAAPTISSNVSETPRNTVQLPIIKLPQFNGNYLEWLRFRDLFNSLVHTTGLTKSQKFHYLKASLVDDAVHVIESLEVTEENYEIAWKLVKDRFENKRILIRNHVNAILELPALVRENYTSLRELVDSVNKHLRALKTLDLPVEHWDALIVNIITSRLDNQTRREWEMSNTSDEPASFEDMMKFLNNRCNYLETLYGGKAQDKKFESKPTNFAKKPTGRPQTQGQCNFVTNSSQKSCIFCKGSHLIYKCATFRELPTATRVAEIDKRNLCRNCFTSGHEADNCKASNCRVCNKKHNTMLHVDSVQAKPSTPEQQISSTLTVQVKSKQVLLSTAMVRVYDVGGCVHELRALLDSGSQSNFLTSNACKRLRIQTESVIHSITGIHQKVVNVNEKVDLTIHSTINKFSTTISCLVLPRITDDIPSDQVSISQLQVPKHIVLADPNFNESRPIDLLIGSGTFWELLTAEPQIRLGRNQPIIQGTVLGWIIGGPVSSRKEGRKHTCLLSTVERQIQSFWEVEEIRDCDTRSEEERACENHFRDNYRRNSSGRFVVKLPFKEDAMPLGDSKQVAEKRFRLLERKLNKDVELKRDYVAFLDEYANLNHMELATEESSNTTNNEFFLPHHAVVRDSITTKVRVVFDGSARTTTGVSLNENLMVGPTIQSDLFSIINRFRMHRFVLTGDIAKMYRQILVAEEDQNFQKILWRSESTEPIRIYRLSTVTYGTACAPYLAIRCINQVAKDEESEFPLARSIIENDFYVDDLITGANTVDELVEIRKQVTSCLLRGGFELRKWTSNTIDSLPEVTNRSENSLVNLDKQGKIKTLGLSWNFKEDQLTYDVIPIDNAAKVTKRFVLSTISKLFDPLGLVGPILTRAKQIMQQLWCLKTEWDEPLPLPLHIAWNDFMTDLPNVKLLKVPRRVAYGGAIELHGYCDASEIAYGACLYIRTTDKCGNYHVHLLCAKSKIAPLKTLSIPRLELCSALLLAKLIRKVSEALTGFVHKIFQWTDSTIVLAWLAAPPNTWKTFIAHRVAEISKYTNLGSWAHVSSANNPADIISRGTNPTNLRNLTLWWQGPTYLKQDQIDWPSQPSIQTTNLEQKGSIILVAGDNINSLVTTFVKYSSWNKLRRVMGYVLRFVNNCKLPKIQRPRQHQLSASEIGESAITIVKIIQRVKFSEEIKQLTNKGNLKGSNRLISLTPFVDPRGLLRVGGRLLNAEISHNRKHQIILPNNNHVTTLIIKYEHMRHLHAGNQATLAAVRENYWPISGRNEVRKLLHKCLNCFKYKPKLMQEIMGNLPSDRVTVSRPFINSGVDYAGPFLVREAGGRNRRMVKCYVALFICFATKAIHVELVGDLTTESFLNALKRFTSRRGHVQNLYSDNGTNFVGAHNELRQLFKSKEFQTRVTDSLSNDHTNWHFIPPRSPHFGGLWEAGVKSVKSHLKRVLGNAAVTFEELYTLLVRIEGCLNSRPLIPLSQDPKDLSALTPGHFLIGTAITSIIDPNYIDTKSNRLSRWQRIDQLHQQFWKRWSKEYLPALQQKVKWRVKTNELCIPNAMVLIHEDNLPPQQWQLGRIIDIHPGDDGVVRVATVQTSSGVKKRCINKLCALPIEP